MNRETENRSNLLHYLGQGAALLHLSVETPDRIPGWDVIILTAANRHQAKFYETQLEAARRRGLIASATITLVVDDPEGRHIGSGGATLNALRHLQEAIPGNDPSRMRVLLIHAGGESRRVPWANIFGKCFIPFPLFADPDRPVPVIFDHQLSITAPLALQMKGGGLVSLSGDVLPLFAASHVRLPDNDALVVTVPASLDMAEHHGVIVADTEGRVVNLLQKAPAEKLVREGALVGGGAALLDTGIYAFAGSAYRALLKLAQSDPDPVSELLERNRKCSLYEDLASAFVPSRHEWLGSRPLGPLLLEALSSEQLLHYRADELAFVHFGTTAEVLEHFSHIWEGRLSRRILTECGAAVAPSAVVYASELAPGVPVGEGSIVYGCRLGKNIGIGNRCIMMGVDASGMSFYLPDNTCLWQVPLRLPDDSGRPLTLLACCGVEDNPKDSLEDSTFCNRSMSMWLTQHEISPEQLWADGETRTLWNARLFAADPKLDRLRTAAWMLSNGSLEARIKEKWLNAKRISLADLHREVDVEAFMRRHDNLRADLILRALERTVKGGLERNVYALGLQLETSETVRKKLITFAEHVPQPGTDKATGIPASRLIQMRSDLMQAGGHSKQAERLSSEAFRAVQKEVASFVKPYEPPVIHDLPVGKIEDVRLPVRFDIAGGWSDTPPYCFERPARVLNMAMMLDGELPVGASLEVIPELKWELILKDANLRVEVQNGDELGRVCDLQDPFALLRTALVLAGFGSGTVITQGVRVQTWARVPKGSGLGTSSILGAALITALQRLSGQPDDMYTVSDLVLLLEQRMTTGGGWQDQIGGLVPGVKCTSSAPVRPIRLKVEPVPLLPGIRAELEKRLIIAFTGVERLAKNVLQIVVGRYLRRDARALAAVKKLVELADDGRQALSLGKFDRLGRVMAEAWHVHQELDPHCSNAEVDAIFHEVEDLAVGGKLAGAGGGGFLGVLAKDEGSAIRIRKILSHLGGGVQVYDWQLWT